VILPITNKVTLITTAICVHCFALTIGVMIATISINPNSKSAVAANDIKEVPNKFSNHAMLHSANKRARDFPDNVGMPVQFFTAVNKNPETTPIVYP
jgi:hypothetical protein